MVIFLNVLYKMFDNTSMNYEVLKVDTVNDCHMLASGLPEKNGDKHASEMADFALDVLAASAMLMIKQRPRERVMMRGSLHSGWVIAGVQVVGSKMPRYRIFGQTVDFVANMNESGEVAKAQISLETKILLDTIGGYKINDKGMIDVKGFGRVESWWLVGKEGVNEMANYEGGTQRIVFDGEEEPEFMKDLAEYSFKENTV